MSKFGNITTGDPGTGFGSDADYPECIHYTLEYKIAVEHTFNHLAYLMDYPWSKSEKKAHRWGEVQIWVHLKKSIVDGRDCGEIPKTQTSLDDPCEFCDDNYIDRGGNFYILHGNGKQEKWDDVNEAYNKQMCIPDKPTIGPTKPKIVRANGLTCFSCIKDWYECGINKKLEDAITPGRSKKLDFDQSPIGGIANDEREYDIACKLFKMFVAASKEDDPECAKCELLCTIINNTIFGSIGSKSGGKPGDCDYVGIPILGSIYEEVCEVRTGLAFEKWLDEELDNYTKDPGPPFNIQECPGCPGCG
jgi:hypothetical protein